MKKVSTALFGFVLLALISMLVVYPAQADVSTPSFIGVCYRGQDLFYGYYSVVAYERGASGTVAVNVYNYGFYLPPYWRYDTANISAVGVHFDWMDKDTYINSTDYDMSKTNPYELEYDESASFIIEFTIPDDVSNLLLHRYEIVVINVNATGGETVIWTYSGSNFAIYSADQADAQELYLELKSLLVGEPPYVPPLYEPSDFISTEARILWTNATIEAYTGMMCYMRGDFAGAKEDYQSSRDLVDQAFASELQKGVVIEDSEINEKNAEANYYNSQADYYEKLGNASKTEADAATVQANAALNQSYAYLLFGLGWVLIGVGIIVYTIRKPKAPPS